MNNGLSGIKNIIWALGIAVVVIALFIGLLFALVTRNSGEREDGILTLGDSPRASSVKTVKNGDEIIMPEQAGTLLELPGTQDSGYGYVFGLTFLCDKTIAALNDYSSDFGSTVKAAMWSDNGGGFPVSSASATEIVYPGDGSLITPATAAMIAQPRQLVIYLGRDNLAFTSHEGFVAGYSDLIAQIQKASPNTRIICCSIASVNSIHSGTDGLNKELMAQANDWIREVCIRNNVFYADLASVLNDSSGYLIEDYAAPDGKSLSSKGVAQFADYFRYHGL